MPKPTTLALVGCGWISEAHVSGYRDLYAAGCRDLVISACCDLNPAAAERRAEEIAAFQGTKPRIFTDVAQLVQAGVAEAADVCLPHCFHHQTAIALLAGGLHVQLEKPLGITVRASRAIIAAAQQANRVLATAENTRRHVGSRAAVWAVRQGLIGEPVAGMVTVVRDEPVEVNDPKWAWRNVKLINGGGPLIDGGAHFADMMRQLWGEPTEIDCQMRTLAPRTEATVPVIGKTVVDVEDWWHAHLRFASGMQVTWTFTSKLPAGPQSSARYYGRNGLLTDESGWPFHAFEGGGSIATRDGARIEKAALEARYLASLSAADKARLFPFGVTNSFAIEVWDFIDAIRSRRAPEMDGAEGLASKALCLACYESATAGRTVRYRDVLDGTIDAYQRPIDQRWGLLPATAAAR